MFLKELLAEDDESEVGDCVIGKTVTWNQHAVFLSCETWPSYILFFLEVLFDACRFPRIVCFAHVLLMASGPC